MVNIYDQFFVFRAQQIIIEINAVMQRLREECAVGWSEI
jgi:hypothetical protein